MRGRCGACQMDTGASLGRGTFCGLTSPVEERSGPRFDPRAKPDLRLVKPALTGAANGSRQFQERKITTQVF